MFSVARTTVSTTESLLLRGVVSAKEPWCTVCPPLARVGMDEVGLRGVRIRVQIMDFFVELQHEFSIRCFRHHHHRGRRPRVMAAPSNNTFQPPNRQNAERGLPEGMLPLLGVSAGKKWRRRLSGRLTDYIIHPWSFLFRKSNTE